MARSMADDYQDTYRARIEYKHRHWDRELRRYTEPKEDAETFVKCYGPYAKKGTAKAQMTYESNGRAIKVISAKVQKASITWEDVDE